MTFTDAISKRLHEQDKHLKNIDNNLLREVLDDEDDMDIDVEHECPLCSKGFGDKNSAEKHFKERHEIETTLHFCDNCPKTFVNEFKKKIHEKDVHEIKLVAEPKQPPPDDSFSYDCTICSRSFSSISRLTTHYNEAHSEIKDSNDKANKVQLSQSDISKLNDIQSSDLFETPKKKAKIEEISEDKEISSKNGKMLKCPVCAKPFKLGPSVLTHCRIFHNLKIKACTKCNMIFKNSPEKQNHRNNVHIKPKNKDLEVKELEIKEVDHEDQNENLPSIVLMPAHQANILKNLCHNKNIEIIKPKLCEDCDEMILRPETHECTSSTESCE